MSKAFELPPLPPEDARALSVHKIFGQASIKAMLESYGRLCVDEALEAAAKKLDDLAADAKERGAIRECNGYNEIGEDIRSLKAG